MSDILVELQEPNTPSVYDFSEDEMPDTPVPPAIACQDEWDYEESGNQALWNSISPTDLLNEPLSVTLGTIDGFDLEDDLDSASSSFLSMSSPPPCPESVDIPASKTSTVPTSSGSSRGSGSIFTTEEVKDFKHIIYNLLVEAHNKPSEETLVQPLTFSEDGDLKYGFRFVLKHHPEKKLPELYAQYIRKVRLDQEDQGSIFVQDLYKYYLRACVELLGKYFEKKDKFTYVFDGTPLFQPNETLDEAKKRLNKMKTRSRKRGCDLPPALSTRSSGKRRKTVPESSDSD